MAHPNGPYERRRSSTQDRALSHAIGAHSLAARSEPAAAVHSGEADETWATPTSWTAFINSFASQDWLLIGYLVTIVVALAFGKGSNRSASIVRVSADLGGYLFVLALVRLQVLRWGSVGAALLYRVAIMATLLGTFFQLREILPAVSPWALDARIFAFDVHVFGVEPSLFFDRYVTETTTEWFAFFYFLYFLILTVHVLPILFGMRDERVLSRFGNGLLMVFLTAHLLYMVVPGWGPYWYLKGSFTHELRGTTFWPLVRETVDAGGAQKDIFPSLHTAVPTFFAIFSYRHRRLLPFKYTWPVIAFLATQIIVATLFLRWHYLVDVVAGLTLATSAAFLGQRVADWEGVRRERMGIQPAWVPAVFPRKRA